MIRTAPDDGSHAYSRRFRQRRNSRAASDLLNAFSGVRITFVRRFPTKDDLGLKGSKTTPQVLKRVAVLGIALASGLGSQPLIRSEAIELQRPIALWEFNAKFIEMPVYDRTGNHNDGFFEGLASGVHDGSERLAAAAFGPYNCINLTKTNVAVQGNAARSIIAWVKTTNMGWQAVIATGTPANGQAFNIVMYSGNGVVGVMGYFDDFYPSTGTSVADGRWHMIAVTYDGNGSLRIYIDGELDNATIMSYVTSGQSNYIGRSNHSGYEYPFRGLIGDVGVFDYALSETQIAFLYNCCRAPSP